MSPHEAEQSAQHASEHHPLQCSLDLIAAGVHGDENHLAVLLSEIGFVAAPEPRIDTASLHNLL